MTFREKDSTNLETETSVKQAKTLLETLSAGLPGLNETEQNSKNSAPLQRSIGTSSNDVIVGGEGDDYLRGGSGDDTLLGEGGNDLLEGGVDNDRLEGGAGFDAAVYRGRFNDYSLSAAQDGTLHVTDNEGNEGSDNLLGVERLNFDDGVYDVETGWFVRHGNHDEASLAQLRNLKAEAVPTRDILGSNGADNLHGALRSLNVIDAGGGNDRISVDARGSSLIFAGDGADTVQGSLYGSDIVHGDGGNDVIRGHWGDDILFGGDGNDRLLGGADDDHLEGGDGDDELRGGYDNDVLRGDAGDDLLLGQQGNDRLDGGAGFDTAVFSGARADYSITQDAGAIVVTALAPSSREGTDRLVDVEALRFSDETLLVSDLFGNGAPSAQDDVLPDQAVGESVLIDTSLLLANDSDPDGDPLTITDIQVVSGQAEVSLEADGRIRLTGQEIGVVTLRYSVDDGNGETDSADVTVSITAPLDATFIGTEEDDIIARPGGMPEVIYALGGDDQVTVDGNQPAIIYAGSGNDRVRGALFGDDTIYGEDGDDSLDGAWGDDTIFGGAGMDFITTGAGDDIADGGAGDDLIRGGYGRETLSGGEGDDYIQSFWNDDQIDGGAGEDTARFLGNFEEYAISGDTGAMTVTDMVTDNGNEGVNQLTDVEFLQFRDGYFNVETSSFVEGGSRPMPGAGGGGSGGGGGGTPPNFEVQEERFELVDPAQVENGVVALKLQNTDSDNAEGGVVTFGHLFKPGDLAAGGGLVALIAGQSYQVQIDVKATHEDGSVKHALLTYAAPELEAGAFVDVVLARTDVATDGPAVDLQAVLDAGFDMTASITFDQGDGTWTVFKSTNDFSGARQDINTTNPNDERPIEVRFDSPQTEPFEIFATARFIKADGSEELREISSMITPEEGGEKAFVDLAGAFGLQSPSDTPGTLAEMTLSGLPQGASLLRGINNGDGTKGEALEIDVAGLLSNALAAGDLDVWMSGPQATEVRLETAVNADLKARFDLRVFANGETRVDVTLLNENPVFTGGDRHYTYDFQLTGGGESLFEANALYHHRDSNWSKTVWPDGRPTLHTIQDSLYLMETGAVAKYDLTQPIRIDTVNYERLIAGDLRFDPLRAGNVETGMPNTGERSDIGVLPDWAARFVISQDHRDFDVLIANGKASGSFPWHLFDEATGEYVSILDHPNLWYNPATVENPQYGEGALPAGTFDYITGFIPENAHQPSLSYLPYLVTGDRYFADELTAQATWNLADIWTDRREQSDTNDSVMRLQVRGAAWSLRTLADAAFALPDESPHRDHFEQVVVNNLNWIIETYIEGDISGQRGMLEGIFDDPWNPGLSEDIYGDSAFWQEDYFAVVMGELAARGFEQAKVILDWQANALAGRYIAGDLGFDPTNGSSHVMPETIANDIEGGSPPRSEDQGRTFTQWSEVQAALEARGASQDQLFRAESSTTIAVRSGVALGAMMTHADNHDAFEAYGFLMKEMSHFYYNTSFQNSPRTAIRPTLKDGTELTNDKVVIGDDGNNNLQSGEGSNLLHGGAGDDVLQGNGGIDLLYGGTGDDEIFGGADDDYIFGNEGIDRLHGGSGNDVIRGNLGADFLFGDEGDDILYYQDGDEVDGGSGNDTLALQNWREASIDLSSGDFRGLETIDLRNVENDAVDVADEVFLDIGSIIDLSDNDDLFIYGDESDRLVLSGQGTRLEDVNVEGIAFSHYVSESGADLFVQETVIIDDTGLVT